MHRQSPVFADCSPYVFNILCLLRAFQSVDHFQQILNHLWSIRATLLFVLHSLHFPESHLNHQSSFWGGMFQLNEKFDADSLLYSLSHFECNSHTVHMLTQWHLWPPLTIQWSRHYSCMCITFSLAARLRRCCINSSHYINNGWSFPRQTSQTSEMVIVYSTLTGCHRLGKYFCIITIGLNTRMTFIIPIHSRGVGGCTQVG